MATIQATITIQKTVASLNAATIQAVIDWAKTNIRDKLPVDATMLESYQVTP